MWYRCYVQQFELQFCRSCLAFQVDFTVGRLEPVAVCWDIVRPGCNVLLKALSFNRGVSNRSIRRTLGCWGQDSNCYGIGVRTRASLVSAWDEDERVFVGMSPTFLSSLTNWNTDMRYLTTGIRSEKCVVRRFVAVQKCIYTNLDSTVYPTTHPGYVV
jgi:hypothetical protein